MLKNKGFAIFQAVCFVAAVAMTAVAFQPTPVLANSEEWCQMNCGGGPTMCGGYVDLEGNFIRCKQDLSSCI